MVHNSVYEVSLKKNLKLIKFRSNYQFIGNKGKNKLSSTMMMNYKIQKTKKQKNRELGVEVEMNKKQDWREEMGP